MSGADISQSRLGCERHVRCNHRLPAMMVLATHTAAVRASRPSNVQLPGTDTKWRHSCAALARLNERLGRARISRPRRV